MHQPMSHTGSFRGKRQDIISGRCIRPREMKGPILFFLDTTSDYCLGYEYILTWCVTKSNQVMSGSGTFRYKLFPVPKGKHLSPDLPSQIEDTLQHHFLRGEFSSRAPKGQGPQLSLGRQGVQLRKNHFPKRRGGKSRDQLRDTLIYSEQQFSECGLWNP